jgi:hypothetical protein
MKLYSNQGFLTVYSGLLTAALAVILLSGSTDQENTNGKKAHFDEITVQRINVVEPDGTLRMVISDKTRSPGIFIKGKEHLPGFHSSAGMIFLNDEGTENGGLIYSGEKDKDGNISSSGHLSFDRYLQDQVLSLDASQYNDQSAVSLRIIDRPSWSIAEYLALVERIESLPPEQQQAEIDKFNATHPAGQRRIFLGRDADQSTSLVLKDTAGRDRIVLRVDPDGTPRLQFLDTNGAVVSELPPRK